VHAPSWWTKEKYILATLVEHLGDVRLTDLHAGVVETFARQRLAKGLKVSTVNNELRVLRRVLNYARERCYLVSASKWKPLTDRGPRRVTWWTRGELVALLAAVKREAPEVLGLVVFLANTGCRKGEALALTWEHVDLARGMVHIWPSEEWEPKNRRPREVPISSELRHVLMRAPRSSAYVFPSRRGGRFAYWPQRDFDRARKAAGLRGGPHTLRHSFAAHFLAGCPDLYLLAQLLGHSHGRTTELYAHLLPEHLERARDVVDVGAPRRRAPATSPAKGISGGLLRRRKRA
jgi:integrase